MAPGALVEIDRVEAVSRDPVFVALVDLLTLRLVVAVVVAFPFFLVKFLFGSVARRRLKAKKEEKVQLFKLHCNLLDPLTLTGGLWQMGQGNHATPGFWRKERI